MAQLTSRRRAPFVAALVALLASLPGLFTLPPMDRDESRFAEASAQMLESGDFTNILFQDEPRYKKPVGVYWLQAASVKALSTVEQRQIWAFRIPSCSARCWRPGLAPGARWRSCSRARRRWPAACWRRLWCCRPSPTSPPPTRRCAGRSPCRWPRSANSMSPREMARRPGAGCGRCSGPGLGASLLLKGPIGPMVVGLTALALAAWDRNARWLLHNGWAWGAIIVAGMVLPWALAITVATDGAFWGIAVGRRPGAEAVRRPGGPRRPARLLSALEPGCCCSRRCCWRRPD